ncbi:MAG: hypothetical protein ACTHOR_04290 [Devosia sp.]
MHDIPAYFLPRPPLPDDPATLSAFDRLYEAACASGGAEIDYRLAAPRWQFLCHVADTRPVLLHGSGNPDIEVFEPRKSNDVNEFGDRKAVYAASDGLWPIYFAILDRANHPMTLINASLRVELADGGHSDPYYFFSITDRALARRPFRGGTIYLLPREGFAQQPPLRSGERIIHLPHWASPVPVRPLARLTVQPEDFPFLAQLRGHDDESTFARARANPDGFPWVEDGQSNR